MTLPIRTRPTPVSVPRASAAPRLLLALLTAGVVLAVTLAPRALAAPARRHFMDLAHLIAGPMLAPMSFGQVESLLNALLFVPLGAALALLLSRRLWILAPMIGLAISITVECTQELIPGRVPSAADILWNGVGALAGAVVAGLLRLIVGGVGPHRRRA